MFIDAANYSEQNTPANTHRAAPAAARSEVTDKPLNQGMGLSLFGRDHARRIPLWDGSNRVLLGFTALRGDAQRRRHPLRQRSRAEEVARLEDDDMTREQRAADAVQDNVPAVVRDLHVRPGAADLADRRRAAARLHAHRPGGARRPRAEPNAIEPTAVDADAGGAAAWR